jgi:hypothetical protein
VTTRRPRVCRPVDGRRPGAPSDVPPASGWPSPWSWPVSLLPRPAQARRRGPQTPTRRRPNAAPSALACCARCQHPAPPKQSNGGSRVTWSATLCGNRLRRTVRETFAVGRRRGRQSRRCRRQPAGCPWNRGGRATRSGGQRPVHRPRHPNVGEGASVGALAFSESCGSCSGLRPSIRRCPWWQLRVCWHWRPSGRSLVHRGSAPSRKGSGLAEPTV